MIRLGWKNLVADKGRLSITLVGVTFAVFLMLVQSGLFFGYMESVAGVIDKSGADIWISSAQTMNMDTAMPIPDEDILRVKSTPGIAWADRSTHGWSYLQLPDGTHIWAQIIGFNPDTGYGGPWEMVEGSIQALRKTGTFVVDEASLPQLRGLRVGDKLENWGQKIEIAGVSRGANSPNTYPVLFASYQTAQEQTFGLDNKLHFIMAKFEEGADREMTMERLRNDKHFDVYTTEEFSAKNQSYWAIKTGIGLAIGLAMLLGFVVGMVIVAQTMYSSTMERIKEYATLKALGATNREICVILFTQALIVALLGYAIGAIMTYIMSYISSGTAISLHMTPAIFVFCFGMTLVMCGIASIMSVIRALRVDPATVFRT